MKTLIFLWVLSSSVCFAQENFARPLRNRLWAIPPEIKYFVPDNPDRRLHAKEYAEEEQEAKRVIEEVAKLAGPQKFIEGEGVDYVYPWLIDAPSKDDPSKTLNRNLLKKSVFIFVSGDPFKRAEVTLRSGQSVIFSRPTAGNAPVSPLLMLAPLISAKGKSKVIIANRLCQPQKIEKDASGGEVWRYHSEITQTRRSARTSTTTTSGTIGIDSFNSTTTQQTPMTLGRTLTLWDFSITFNRDGIVGSLEQGNLAPSEWREVLHP